MTIRATSLGATIALALVWWIAAGDLSAAEVPRTWEEFGSATWEALRESVIGDANMIVDGGGLNLVAPSFGEDSAAVPITIETKPSLGEVRELVLLVDRNPYPVILKARPAVPLKSLSLRIRMQESGPVRVAARTADGVWHVTAKFVQVSGGGCSEGGGGAGDPEAKLLGKVRLAAWGRTDGARVRFQVVHPMDTGLARDEKGGFVPAFYVFKIGVQSGSRLLLELESTPIARNPTFTADLELAPIELAALKVSAFDSKQSVFLSEDAQVFLDPGLDMSPAQTSRN